MRSHLTVCGGWSNMIDARESVDFSLPKFITEQYKGLLVFAHDFHGLYILYSFI